MFENRVLGKILGSKRDEVTGEFRRLQNVEGAWGSVVVKALRY